MEMECIKKRRVSLNLTVQLTQSEYLLDEVWIKNNNTYSVAEVKCRAETKYPGI